MCVDIRSALCGRVMQLFRFPYRARSGMPDSGEGVSDCCGMKKGDEGACPIVMMKSTHRSCTSLVWKGR